MAGSRREKVGSIFARLTGLIRSGAVKEEDRPIWYDVVKALPPKPIPPPKEVQKILYPEDFVRVHFYKKFADPGAAVLTNERIKSVPQRFVDKYLELHSNKAVPSEQLFDETVRILKEEGARLVTHEERQAFERSRADSRPQRPRPRDLPEDDDYNKSFVTVEQTTDSRLPQNRQAARPKVDIDDLFKEKT